MKCSFTMKKFYHVFSNAFPSLRIIIISYTQRPILSHFILQSLRRWATTSAQVTLLKNYIYGVGNYCYSSRSQGCNSLLFLLCGPYRERYISLFKKIPMSQEAAIQGAVSTNHSCSPLLAQGFTLNPRVSISGFLDLINISNSGLMHPSDI